MSDDLGDACITTVERIKGQGGAKARLGMGALMWISLAERPLTVEELRPALAVEVGSKDMNPGSVPSIEIVLGSCLGLVIVDRETSTPRLIHETLQEYLRTHLELFRNPHATIAKACLSYLNLQSLKELSATDESLPRHPLLSYASNNWGNHARKELTRSVEILALEILSRMPKHIAARLALGGDDVPTGSSKHNELSGPSFVTDRSIRCCRRGEAFGGLHCAAFFGIPGLVGVLLAMGIYNLNQKDSCGCTPLMRAAQSGHGAVVRMLLDQASVNLSLKSRATEQHSLGLLKNGMKE